MTVSADSPSWETWGNMGADGTFPNYAKICKREGVWDVLAVLLFKTIQSFR
jgi:hypothetical protein